MIKTIIVDDESRSRETILELVKLYCEDVKIVGQAEDVKSGLLAIRKHKPDLVLLDIKMPDGTGFDLVRQIDPINFKIIFVTAYEEYAIKAFKFSALDYLLKPIDPEELTIAIEKVSKSLNNERHKQ
jgi:two-component system, LytTR family, response regulator